ncbi:MAG: 3-deoxy-7-phosphoheptulonate synthase class II, partial [Candidatus Saccharibacteria bacterium]
LTSQLGEVQRGEAFLIHEGPCAESFDDPPEAARKLFGQVILPTTVILGYGAGLPIVKVARTAGQFGKPRSSDTEVRDGISLPSYRGDIVNSPDFTEAARRPNPDRLLYAYNHSKETIREIGILAREGFADLDQMHEWNINFSGTGEDRKRFKAVSDEISLAMRFMRASGIDTAALPTLHEAEAYVSHEALILDYEAALTRQASDGKLYDTSAHMLWVGERTRGIDDAHIAFAQSISNPVGVKLGPNVSASEVLEYCERLNPDRIPGRLTLISRMGVDQIDAKLPPLIESVRESGHSVVWECDPMHGNTFTADTGQKTRRFSDIRREVEHYFEIHQSEGTWPGGIHLEVTSEDVTECLGGSEPTTVTDLGANYKTYCDPRLNSSQSLELAFLISEMLEKMTK